MSGRVDQPASIRAALAALPDAYHTQYGIDIDVLAANLPRVQLDTGHPDFVDAPDRMTADPLLWTDKPIPVEFKLSPTLASATMERPYDKLAPPSSRSVVYPATIENLWPTIANGLAALPGDKYSPEIVGADAMLAGLDSRQRKAIEKAVLALLVGTFTAVKTHGDFIIARQECVPPTDPKEFVPERITIAQTAKRIEKKVAAFVERVFEYFLRRCDMRNKEALRAIINPLRSDLPPFHPDNIAVLEKLMHYIWCEHPDSAAPETAWEKDFFDLLGIENKKWVDGSEFKDMTIYERRNRFNGVVNEFIEFAKRPNPDFRTFLPNHRYGMSYRP